MSLNREFRFDQQLKLYELFHSIEREVSGSNLSKGRLIGHYDALEKIWPRFGEEHHALVLLRTFEDNCHRFSSEDEYFSRNKDMYRVIHGKYVTIKEMILNQLEEKSKAHLQCSIPKFSGSQTEWNAFSYLFKTQIGLNSSLTSKEKLQLLKENVSGEASQFLKDIPVSEQKYDQAWETLTKKYDNKRFLVDSYLSNTCKLQPISSQSSHEIKELLSTTIKNLESLSAIGRHLEQSDIIVYITVEKLDSRTRQLWEKSLENSTDPPSFERLKAFLQGRILTLEDSEGV